MSKYDCAKTLDFAHESKRLCDSSPCCSECPMDGMNCLYSGLWVNEKNIAIVQKWSDEHPEKLKLTKDERAFIEGLDERTSICRLEGTGLWLRYFSIPHVPIRDDWFDFINTGDEWKVSDLLKLEVEDD